MEGNGVLLSLDRERAKQLFGHREDAPLAEFVMQLRSELAGSENCLDLGASHGEIETSCQNLAQRNEEWASLGAGVCGARPLHQGSEWTISLVRPDLTRMIGETLGSISLESLGCDTEEAAVSDSFRATFESLKSFYQAAAARGDAVLFSMPH